MQVTLILRHDSSAGPVYIGQAPDSRFVIWWKGESLGGYTTVQQAINDACGGHHWSASDGTDLGTLGLSDSLTDWLAMPSGVHQ